MARRFSEDSTPTTRAVQFWLILIAAAHNRQILTPRMIADLTNLRSMAYVAKPLCYLRAWCANKELPPLTVIMSTADAENPSQYRPLRNLDRDRERVFSYPWFDLIPPTADELEQSIDSRSAEIVTFDVGAELGIMAAIQKHQRSHEPPMETAPATKQERGAQKQKQKQKRATWRGSDADWANRVLENFQQGRPNYQYMDPTTKQKR